MQMEVRFFLQFICIFFFYLGFLSRIFTIHKITGTGEAIKKVDRIDYVTFDHILRELSRLLCFTYESAEYMEKDQLLKQLLLLPQD